jgi:hypothetical protein
MADILASQFGASLTRHAAETDDTVLRCPADRVFGLVEALMAAGATNVTVRTLDYVFDQANPLAEKLFGRLAGQGRP